MTAAVPRGLWLTRNDFIFNNVWTDVKKVLRRIQNLAWEWKPIYKEAKMEEMMRWLSFLEKLIQEPLKIGSV
jgi:hypothetical protein